MFRRWLSASRRKIARTLGRLADSRISDHYALLRTRLQRLDESERGRRIAVVGAVSGDGATLTAVNLAISMAREAPPQRPDHRRRPSPAEGSPVPRDRRRARPEQPSDWRDAGRVAGGDDGDTGPDRSPGRPDRRRQSPRPAIVAPDGGHALGAGGRRPRPLPDPSMCSGPRSPRRPGPLLAGGRLSPGGPGPSDPARRYPASPRPLNGPAPLGPCPQRYPGKTEGDLDMTAGKPRRGHG